MDDRTQPEVREPHLTGGAPPLLPDLAALMPDHAPTMKGPVS